MNIAGLTGPSYGLRNTGVKKKGSGKTPRQPTQAAPLQQKGLGSRQKKIKVVPPPEQEVEGGTSPPSFSSLLPPLAAASAGDEGLKSECCAERALLRYFNIKATASSILAASAYLNERPASETDDDVHYGFRKDIALYDDASRVRVSGMWSFIFGHAERLYGGIKVCGGGSNATLSTMNQARMEGGGDGGVAAVCAILCFLKRHFIVLPWTENAKKPSFPLFSSVLAYVRSRLQFRLEKATAAYFELLLLVTVWHEQLSCLDDCCEDGGSLATLRIAVEFVDRSDTLKDGAFDAGGAGVPDTWARSLCETASTISAVKRRQGISWQCQFTNMGPMLLPVFQYYQGILKCHPSSVVAVAVAAAHVFATPLLEAVSRTPVEFTAASIIGATTRLPIAGYRNDFTWMLVAAAVLGRAQAMSVAIIDAAEDVVGETDQWGDVCICIPTTAPVPPMPAFLLTTQRDEETETQEAATIWPLQALQQLIFKDAMVRYHAPFKSRFSKKKNDFLFERTAFSPPPTPFGASTRQVSGVLPALNRLVETSAGSLDVISVTVTASILLHQEVNDMFTFSEKALRTLLKDGLKEQLAAFPGASCYHAHEGSFLSHASTALWAWMFEQHRRRPEWYEQTCLRMMALACQASVQYPEVEQLALWTGLVRLCHADTHVAELVGKKKSDAYEDAAAPREDKPADDCAEAAAAAAAAAAAFVGKLSLAVAKDPLSAALDAFKSEEDMHVANVRYVQTMACTRAAACLTRRSASLAQVRALGHLAFRRAVIERVLLMGNWGTEECKESERAMSCALFGTESQLELFLECVYNTGKGMPARLMTPYVDAEDPRLSNYISLLVDAVDRTSSCTCRQANATLFYLQPLRHLETVVEKIAVSCVIWED